MNQMDKVAAVDRAFPLHRRNKGDSDTSQRPKLAKLGEALAVLQPNILKALSSPNVCLVFVFLAAYLNNVISAQPVANFTIADGNYSCASNIICLGDAHAFGGDQQIPNVPSGSLALIDTSTRQVGIAYYNQQVRLLANSQSASFSAFFKIELKLGVGSDYSPNRGDGLTFLISANKDYKGAEGEGLGIFNTSYSTPFKSIVVEFDTFTNNNSPVYDINDNHVSFDFGNITAAATASASNVGVDIGSETTKYAWVDYIRDTQQLEVRLSYNNITRPTSPLLNYKVNLVDVVEENMWVGFSSSAGNSFSNFFIREWTFESYGLPTTGVKRRASKVGIIVGITVGVLAFVLASIVGICLIVLRRRSRSRGQLWWGDMVKDDPMMQLEGMPERFSYKQLSVATKAFSEETKLGQGGFGSVYHGVLHASGISVAVKRINTDSSQGEKEFMAEVSIISRLRHRNLIQLQGWCIDASREKYLLVYDLMPNGSLDKVLFESSAESGTPCLSWTQRFDIVKGTAAALDYLHQGWKQQVIHRDVKSSNIMLDEEWNAKLGDFGLARLVDHQKSAPTTSVVGTYGYIAPEVVTSGRFTDKTDVYAFGAVVLEVACGRRAFTTDGRTPEEYSLVDWVWQSLSEGAVLNAVDNRLAEYDSYWMKVLLIVGLQCSHPNPLSRPSMRQVVQVLAGDAPVPSIPASKPRAVYSSDFEKISIDGVHVTESGSSYNSRSGSVSMGSFRTSNSKKGYSGEFLNSSSSFGSRS